MPRSPGTPDSPDFISTLESGAPGQSKPMRECQNPHCPVIVFREFRPGLLGIKCPCCRWVGRPWERH